MAQFRFFCCLPLRVGAWFFTLLFFAWGTVLTVIGWYGVARYNATNLALTRSQQIALIITTASWTLLPVITLIGFGAIVARSARVLSLYAILIWLQLAGSVGTGAYFLSTLYRRGGNGAFVNNCETRISFGEEQSCREAFNVLRGVITAVYIFIWLVQIWGGVTFQQFATEIRRQGPGGGFNRVSPGLQPTLPVLEPIMMPPPEPPMLQPAPPPRFGPRASPQYGPPSGQPPQPAFAPNAGGVSLPPPVPFNGNAAQPSQPQAPYAFASQRNSFGARTQQIV